MIGRTSLALPLPALLVSALLAGASFPALAADQHVMVSPEQIAWAPGPPMFPKGQEIAVIAGDPSKSGPYVVRAKVPAGYEVPPHTHPTDESVTVLSGRFHVSMGPSADKSKGMAFGPGGFFHAPKDMAHYAWFSEPSIIQVHGLGPFDITYLNPKDDPRKKD